MARGEKLPPKYFHTYDLFVALTAAAAATSRLRVGSGICLIVERDPITTAKEVAPRSIISPAGVSSSASAQAGIARRCETTAPTPEPACA